MLVSEIGAQEELVVHAVKALESALGTHNLFDMSIVQWDTRPDV